MVQIADTRVLVVRQVLVVAARVAMGIGVIHLSCGMERLVQVANIVDNKAQGERLLVVDVRELLGDLLDVH